MSLKVGVHEFDPITIHEDGMWSGFEVDIWRSIAEKLELQYTFEHEPSLDKLLERTASGEFDVALAGISRTTGRSERVDFTYLTLDTGLSLGVRASRSLSLRELTQRLFSETMIQIVTILFVFSLVVAHGYWFFERGSSVSAEYAVGIVDSIWWAFVTASTVGYGDISPETLGGKLFSVFAIMIGLAIFGLFIAQLSSSLTLRRMQYKIANVDDVRGKVVAVKAHTTAAAVARDHGAVVKTFKTVAEAVDSVMRGTADAVIADAPPLQRQHILQPDFLLVGGLFARQSYAFALAPGSSIAEGINQELIALREHETYDAIYTKYFG